MKKGKTIIIILILVAVAVGIIIYEKKKDESEQNNTVNAAVNNTSIVDHTDNTIINETNETNTASTSKSNENNAGTGIGGSKPVTPSELVVYREGTGETVESKEYSSTLGYTMRYSTEYFTTSFHDNIDWFEASQSMNCVAAEKESDTYANKLASLLNYEKTTVNGYEAVYVTRRVEGQYEKIFYVNTEKGLYRLTTSCQDNVEYLEGLGKIMDAMVQTFAVK